MYAFPLSSLLILLFLYREFSSPRCQSRESTESSVPPRCPSGESMYSDRGGMMRGMALPSAALSPVGVALPATLPPAAAAALLPPNSAAMAAYLGAAAAAAQHSHRLMMTSPLPAFTRGPVSPLVTSSSSPPGIPLPGIRPPPSPTSIPLQSPISADPAILDFSTKKSANKISEPAEIDGDVMNLSKPLTPTPPTESALNSPLDLSVSSRKRGAEEPVSQPPARKTRSSDYKPPALPQWPSPVAASHLPYFAAAVAAASTLSPKQNHMSANHTAPDASAMWNGKMKQGTPTPSDATKALEKMSELSKLGGEDLFRSMANSGAASNSASSRHSAWQSHWLNKGAEQAKDVLKCVWCKQSFPSLAAMTTHMKEAKHCGVNVPVPPMQSTNVPPPQHLPPVSQPATTSASVSSSASSNSGKSNQSDLNLLIKETMPLPRKLVRGQDVWLGKGAEQTRQILKCMWCGQSFRSLAEMTSHMQQTQHYTNIISQEQIISWKSTDDAKGGGGGGGSGGGAPGGGGGASGTSSHVSAVLTCKVCDQAFSSLKELSNHMVKNSHYKEHIMRSITESGGRRRQTREKRKKSLPVRKLLELERAQHDFKNGDAASLMSAGGKTRDPSSAGRITCEKCGDKIETSIFVEHIRQCVGGGNISSSQRNFLKNALMSSNIIPPENPLIASHMGNHDGGRKSVHDESPSPGARHHRSPSSATDLTTASSKDSGATAEGNSSSPSVLNAIEKLIEKSFDSRARQNPGGFPGVPGAPSNAPIGSSILKRLGIDESVDYTKPLVDPQTMNILRSYHHQNQHSFSRRERSGSESSSVSERGSSRVDSLTPDRKMDPPHITSTPRTTPDKRVHTPSSDKLAPEESPDTEITIKKEIDEERVHESNHQEPANIKREEYDDGEDDERSSYHSNGGIMAPRMSTDSRAEDLADEDATSVVKHGSNSIGAASPIMSPRQPTPSAIDPGVPNSPCRNSTCSPASSDRSGTPRSTNGSEKKAGGSLGALSSMFDSLSGMNSATDGGTSSGRRTSSHPLAALQKLCDKTETHHSNNSRPSSSSAVGASVSTASTSAASSVSNSTGTTPGAILAFSWACNDAVMTSDSIMKCAFCDTPFISKGAYRHHLSKMHFVKDGVIPDPVALKVQQSSRGESSGAPPTTPSKGSASGGSGAPAGSGSAGSSSRPSSKSPPAQGGYEESPHSKFLKYTELAKQLSSKYV